MQFEAQVQIHNMRGGGGFEGTARSRYLEKKKEGKKNRPYCQSGEGTNNCLTSLTRWKFTGQKSHQMKVYWTKVSPDESLLDKSLIRWKFTGWKFIRWKFTRQKSHLMKVPDKSLTGCKFTRQKSHQMKIHWTKVSSVESSPDKSSLDEGSPDNSSLDEGSPDKSSLQKWKGEKQWVIHMLVFTKQWVIHTLVFTKQWVIHMLVFTKQWVIHMLVFTKQWVIHILVFTKQKIKRESKILGHCIADTDEVQTTAQPPIMRRLREEQKNWHRIQREYCLYLSSHQIKTGWSVSLMSPHGYRKDQTLFVPRSFCFSLLPRKGLC